MISHEKRNDILQITKKWMRSAFWFFLGAIIGLFFFASFVFIYYQHTYENIVYPGVYVAGHDFSGYSKGKVQEYFRKKNIQIEKTIFSFKAGSIDVPKDASADAPAVATASAGQLNYGYDEELLAQQAYSIGKSDNLISNISIIFQAYINGVNLPAAYHYSEDAVDLLLTPMQKQINTQPVNALFSFENGRVAAFQPSRNGQAIDTTKVKEQLDNKMSTVLSNKTKKLIAIIVPIKTIPPEITTDKVNNLGITELIASGTSLFEGSIPNRIYNIQLAASRLNGVLIPPEEVFSFAKAVGDVSSLTGYKQAYVIENGKTVLGDGGGVCQVSTTLFRAALHAGLPIVERNPHAYRVHYYEEDSPPGIDAAVYVPSVDLKFKNDTGHSILIQSYVDEENLRLTFDLYGTKDNREIVITTPVIKSQTPAPEPLNQDDPTLPKGVVKQVDFAAAGASVYFTRTVKKDGKIVEADRFDSNYRPWRAIFLHGTKEN